MRELFEELREALERQLEGRARLPETSDADLRLATTVLCLSIVRADDTHTQDEHRVLARTVRRLLDLDQEQARVVIRLAEEESRLPKPLTTS